MPAAKQLAFDIDGPDATSSVLLELINSFPGLGTKTVEFSTLEENSGIGFFPTNGAVILSEKEDILGHVTQICLYPFTVVYRAAPKTDRQKVKIKEFLDALGRWLERQPVTVSGTEHRLTAYPALQSGDRTIKSISRTSPAYMEKAYNDGVEDWSIEARLTYENKFSR